MKQPLFDNVIAKKVEELVTDVFECKLSGIVSYPDTFEKKVVVFILYHFYKFDWLTIGKAYQMIYLYVPTVATQLEYRYKNDEVFKNEINRILKQLGYGIEKVDQGRRNCA